ncbi:MAG: hypothetical protein ACI9W4_001228 [Rhodothermales bacterium]|jgi:hypothetical protein
MRQLGRGLALGCALVMAACEFTGPLGGLGVVTPVVAVDSFRTVVAGAILDASTGAPISGSPQLSFAGEAGPLVRDLLGAPVEGWTNSEGFASFGIANSVRPRADRPVGLRVIARATGYQTNSTRIEMRRDGRHEFRLLLAREGAPPAAGQGSAEFDILNDSTVAQTLVNVTSLGREVLSVRLPARSAAESISGGAVVSGGQVLRAAWSPPSSRALSLFPGGMDSGLRSLDGFETPATITTGAIISMSVPGTGGLLFGDSLMVTSLISSTLKSPRTNAPILPGDVVDILRWRPEAGLWREHAQAEVHRIDGALAASFRSAQTGTFSVGFLIGHCADARVTLSGNSLGGAVVAWHGNPGQADALRVWRFGPDVGEVVLDGPPSFWQGTLEVRHGQSVAQVNYASLCDAHLDVSLERVPALDLAEVRASPTGCSSFGVTDVPTLSVLAVPGPSPLSGGGALLRPPYTVKKLTLAHASSGRATGFSFGPVGYDDTLYLVLGGRHWAYSSPKGGTLDVSAMAQETGLCS